MYKAEAFTDNNHADKEGFDDGRIPSLTSNTEATADRKQQYRAALFFIRLE